MARNQASTALILRTIGIKEATYYARRQRLQKGNQARTYRGGRPQPGYSWTTDGKRISDEQIKEYLMELMAGEESAYGYRKLRICLQRKHQLIINKKKTYRLCKELDILMPQRQTKPRYPRRIARNRTIHRSNELWELDIKYGYIAGEDRFFYLMAVLDVYDRSVIDYHIGLNCEGKHAAQTLQRALWKRKVYQTEKKPVIRTDNGPQFISRIFEETCEHCQVEHERIPPKTPNLNAHIESFHASLERDCYQKHEFTTYHDAYQIVTEYIDFYNQRRIHGSLYDLPPATFRRQVAARQVPSFTVTL
ncbi:IS3 family transposase [Heliophilum fasciatum]|uniref:IS3 family transposase n=1 Tax=Heliophilum fasciatum TaxID=35700 RepID=UPI002227DC25|nr:IS3 family transposase [Heliophilum fasciatum]